MSLLDRDLEYFLAIAVHSSLARAAAFLGVSQPTLSRSMQKLESQLGAQLLERTASGVALTPAGRRLAQRAQVAQVALDDAAREIRDTHEGRRGIVRVAVGFTLWPLVADSLIPRLQIDRPAAVLDLNVMPVEQIVQTLMDGEYDFGVCVLPQELPDGLASRKLLTDRLVPVVRTGHPLTGGRVEPAQLLEYPWIGVHSRTATHSAIVDAFNRLGLTAPKYSVRTQSFEVALATVERTDFVAFAPQWRTRAWSSSLVPLDTPEIGWSRNVVVLQRKAGYLGPLARRALELLTDHAQVSQA